MILTESVSIINTIAIGQEKLLLEDDSQELVQNPRLMSNDYIILKGFSYFRSF